MSDDPNLTMRLDLSREKRISAEKDLRAEFRTALKALEDKLQAEYFALDKEHRERVDAMKNVLLKVLWTVVTLGAATGGGAWWMGGG